MELGEVFAPCASIFFRFHRFFLRLSERFRRLIKIIELRGMRCRLSWSPKDSAIWMLTVNRGYPRRPMSDTGEIATTSRSPK